MRQIGGFLLVLLVGAFLLVLPVATQEEEGTIARIVFYRAKPGMNQQMEDGLKQHLAWHRQQNDPWNWLTWQYISGKETGMYGGGTFGHKWEDFDNVPLDEAADEADVAEKILPYVAPGVVWAYYEYLPKVSKPVQDWPSPMPEVVVFRVRYGKSAEFNHLIKKFHKAIEKTNWPVHYEWYALMNGGEMPEYVLVISHQNWASLEGPDKPFPAMLEEAVGRQEAEALLERLSKVVKSQTSSIIRNRADLSYIPEDQ
jgi:hypothetical protein